jgi:hypothetical protein
MGRTLLPEDFTNNRMFSADTFDNPQRQPPGKSPDVFVRRGASCTGPCGECATDSCQSVTVNIASKETRRHLMPLSVFV